MNVYGKMIEYKDALFEAVCPYDLSISPNYSIPVYWASSLDLIENLDTDVFFYDPDQDAYKIWTQLSGVYELNYTVTAEATSNSGWSTRFTRLSSGILKGTASDTAGSVIQKTVSSSIVRTSGDSNETTNTMSTTIRLTEPSWLTLLLQHANTRVSLYLVGGSVSISLKRIRPITNQDIL